MHCYIRLFLFQYHKYDTWCLRRDLGPKVLICIGSSLHTGLRRAEYIPCWLMRMNGSISLSDT